MPDVFSSSASSSGQVGEALSHPRGQQLGKLVAGRYHLDRYLGAGGMGEVYVATDQQGGRSVALKILHRHVSDNPALVRRFLREAQILGRLDNPHTVRLYDSGQAEDGALYLAMEYLEGETLASLLDREGRIDPKRALRLTLAVLTGLAAAHRSGIIHRDIKPANILLVRGEEDDLPTIKLLDFGIAKIADIDMTTTLTAIGSVFGTPRYMSPEQVLGHPVDHRSDLFSVGIILYRALTGWLPFDGSRVEELIYSLVHSSPKPPSRRWQELDTWPEMDRIVLRTIAKRPEDRYQSADEMIADLSTLLSEVLARPARRQSRRATVLVRAGVVAVLGAALLAVLELPVPLGKPFPSFAIESGLVVSALIHPEFIGFQHGIQPGDIILAVDGMNVRRTRDVYAYVRRLAPETLVTYTLLRNDKPVTAKVPVSRLKWSLPLQLYGRFMLVGLVFLFIGSVTAWNRPQLLEARALLSFTSTFGLYLCSTLDYDLVDWMPWLLRLATATGGSACIHLGLAFPNPSRLAQRPWLLGFLYAPGLVSFAVWQALASNPQASGACYHFGLYLWLFGLVALLGLLLHARFAGKTLLIRQQARFMLWATGAVFLGVMIGVLPVFLENMDPDTASLVTQIGMLSLIILPLAIAYQIRQRQLFDLDRIVSRILWALGGFAALLGVFGAVAGAVVLACRLLEVDRSIELILAAVAGMAVVLVVRDPLSRLGKAIVLNQGVHGPSVIAEFSNAAANTRSADEVIQLLFDTLHRHYQPLDLRLLDRKGSGYLMKTRSASDESGRAARRSDIDIEGNETEESRRQLLTPEIAGRHVSRLGRWKAHAYLLVALSAQSRSSSQSRRRSLTSTRGTTGTTAARTIDTSLVLVGPRSDGKAYSSEAAGLVMTLVRLAAERLNLLMELPTIAQ